MTDQPRPTVGRSFEPQVGYVHCDEPRKGEISNGLQEDAYVIRDRLYILI